jgi:hypothetical protein
LDLTLGAMRLGLEAQGVIGLRLTQAICGELAVQEASRMIAEKTWAAGEAYLILTRSVMDGEGHLAAARALVLYRRRVRANHRRLVRDHRTT